MTEHNRLSIPSGTNCDGRGGAILIPSSWRASRGPPLSLSKASQHITGDVYGTGTVCAPAVRSIALRWESAFLNDSRSSPKVCPGESRGGNIMSQALAVSIALQMLVRLWPDRVSVRPCRRI